MTIDSFRGEYSFLSNFYREEGELSAEHYFQALKAEDDDEGRWVLASPSPGEAKRRGRKIKLRNDWEDVKLSAMEVVLRFKFANPGLRKKLVDTGDEALIEGNTWNDTFWGVYKGNGRNELGKLLMKLREEYRNA